MIKLSDDGAEKFIKKAGTRVVGVWDIPRDDELCGCSDRIRNQAKNWTKDPETGWFICKTCDGISKPTLSVGVRLRMALGKNRLRDFRK